MAKQTVNFGAAPTGVGGDTSRSGSVKFQANDNEIYDQLGANAQGVLPAALPVNKGGTGATTAEAARANLGLGAAATKNVGTSIGDVMGVGAFGVGGILAGLGSIAVATQAENPKLESGLYDALDIIGSFVTLKSPWGTLLIGGSTFNGTAPTYAYYNSNSGNKVLTLQAVHTFRTTQNTSIDGNGFIKAASPIAQLFADRIELNNEAQLQDIIFEKLAVGDYLIKGSTGFANQGWYIEMPKDANGNVLVAVVYEQLANNNISVKTYAKKFDEETGDIIANLTRPRDIPASRWIDLRLQELPQPEIQLSNTPVDFQPTGIAQAVKEMMDGTKQ